MLAADVVAKIRYLELYVRHKVTDLSAGSYLSAFRGRGMEFDRVRAYIPGDDVRTIDWNVTARMQQPFVKVHREERELTVMLIVDGSMSMDFGSVLRTKFEVATEVTAIFAMLAAKNNDRVGLIVPTKGRSGVVTPKRQQLWALLSCLGRSVDQAQRLDVPSVMRVCGRRSLVVYLSDFRDPYDLGLLQKLGERHEVLAVAVDDPLEQFLPDVGCVGFADLESGETIELDLGDEYLRQSIITAERQRRADLQSLCRKRGIELLAIDTTEEAIDKISDCLRARGRRV